MYVLVDCNNFFVSCERVFAPNIENRPVVVLSNNDGCVISRSAEAKKLGIKMGEPYFKIKELCQKKNVVVFSSNFALYGNLSDRVMRILQEEAPEIEVYSIDEAFLRYPEDTPFEYFIALREKVKKWTGIPTSIGMGPTKTLAKVAMEIAKKEGGKGIYTISTPQIQEEILKEFPVGEIWGIGKRIEARLLALGITTAKQFRDMDSCRIRNIFGVTGQKTQLELRGTPCFSFGEMSLKKSILCSRTFAKPVTDSYTLSLALSSHVQEVCEKLRAQNSYARAGEVFIEVKKPNNLRDYLGSSFYVPFPANDTPTLLTVAKEALFSLLRRPAIQAKRCGILLCDFVQEENLETDLFWTGLNAKKRQLMATVDSVNARFGKNTLFYASSYTRNCSFHSPHYTTCWDELPKVNS
jgi:DNA polymerase V